jgi:alkylation response protein AidB-like acyl-CoA dehydrogenase
VWDPVIVPLLQADDDGGLQATTVMGMLCEREPGRYGSGHVGVKAGRKEDKLGQRASNTTDVIFEDVKVPKSALLGAGNEGERSFPNALGAVTTTTRRWAGEGLWAA